jgi:RHS repeat-associated protein
MKTNAWLALTGAALLVLSPREAMASGSCTAARFHDWQDKGCNQNHPGAGGPAAAKGCSDCGMPRWWVSEPYVNLCVSDTPLSYQTSSGKDMDFQFLYRQRVTLPGSDEVPTYGSSVKPDNYPSPINCGTNAGWSHNWNMSVVVWDASWVGQWHAQVNGSGLLDYIYPGYPAFSDHTYEAYVFQPNGGIQYFNLPAGARDPASQALLTSLASYPQVTNSPTPDPNNPNLFWGDDNANVGMKLVYPDGSQEIFGLVGSYYIPTGNIDNVAPSAPSPVYASARFLLTKRIDPEGRTTQLGYELITPHVTGAFRLKYVVDPDYRTNQFSYTATNNFQVSEIDDPYGRNTTVRYDVTGTPTNITDAAGLSSSFQYPAAQVISTANYYSGTNDLVAFYTFTTNVTGWITNLSTPYGNTAFAYYEMDDGSVTGGVQQRAIYASEPTGANQLYYYLHKGVAANGTALLATTALAPTVPGQTNFDDGTTGGPHPTLEYRNTIYWGRRQFTALSSNVQALLPGSFSNALANLTTNDFRKGRVRNWLWQPDITSISESLSSEREPSPDATGLIEGSRIWYDYPGRTDAAQAGTSPQISCIAQILPDHTTNYATYGYYPFSASAAGFVSNRASTYTKPDNTIGVLTNSFYYAANNVDLVSVSNSAGQYVNYGYNGSHQIIAITNALNQVTALSWDSSTHNLTSIQYPSSASIGLSYYSLAVPTTSTSGLLQRITNAPAGRSFTINNYQAGNPSGITDDRGLTVTNTWDGLNRPTSMVFPDGTSISNVYYRLDLVATKDRLTNWTYFGFDGLQHLTAVTNANNAVTTYSWCGCGSLNSIVDALANYTYLNYDNQGNLTGVSYPDGSSLTNQYDAAARLTNTVDGAGRWLRRTLNIQGLPITLASADGTLESIVYDALNRPISVTDANGVTVTNTFNALNELVKRTWADNLGEGYGYSAAGLVAYTNRDGKVTIFGLDAAGRRTAETNANQEVTKFAYDSLDNIISLIDGLNHSTTWQYNQFGWLTNKIDALNRNAFRYLYNANGWVTNRWTPEKGNTGYAYDNVGNLKAINYPLSTINYSYNLLNELTNMVDGLGSHNFGWTPNGQLASESDAWTTLSYTYVQGLRTAMTIGTNWTQSYGYDSSWRLTNTISPAGAFKYGFGFQPASALVTGISLPNGANIANSYDSLARLTGTSLNNYWGHTLDGYTYGYDPLGLRTNIVRNLGLTTNSVNVGYDNIEQITSWNAKEFSGAPRLNEQLGFGYDAAHNLHTRNNGNLTQTFTVDAANELTNVTRTGTYTVTGATPAPAVSVKVNGNVAQFYGDFTFALTNISLVNGTNTFTIIATNIYGKLATNILTLNFPTNVNLNSDNNGNLTNDGVKAMSYDAENQLTNVTVPNSIRKDFVYDGLNRLRIKREYGWISSAWSKTNEVRYVWDGNVIVQLRDSNNVPTLTLTRGLDLSGSLQGAGGIGGLLAMTESSGASSYYHSDALGNVTALMDGYENTIERRAYDPFARTTRLTGSKIGVNPFWYSSQLHDEDFDFYSFEHRILLTNPPRWATPDPLGEAVDLNRYRPVRNNPVNDIDPLGLLDYYYSGGGVFQPSGPIPYLEGDSWYGQLGSSIYNTIPLAANALNKINPFTDVGTGEGAASGNGDYLGMAMAGAIDAAGMVPGEGAGAKAAGKVCLKGKAAKDAASKLGFNKRIPPQKAPFNTHGQPLFQDGKKFITPDIDAHKGGTWKMFDSNGNRLGTYDANLNWIAD